MSDFNSSSDTYSLGATYYPVNQLGISGEIKRSNEEHYDVNTYNLGINYFVTPNISLGGNYEVEKTDYDSLSYDGTTDTLKTISATASFRF